MGGDKGGDVVWMIAFHTEFLRAKTRIATNQDEDNKPKTKKQDEDNKPKTKKQANSTVEISSVVKFALNLLYWVPHFFGR